MIKDTKYLLFLFCLCFTSIVNAQKNEEITTLNFPYGENYIFHLSGETTIYDEYNFPAESYPYRAEYRSHNIRETKKGNLMNFSIRFITENEGIDTNKIHVSELIINKKGMAWWGILDKDKKEIATKAISLPLSEGSTWKSKLYGQKDQLYCFSLDTLIETYLGKVKAFGIKHTIILDENKEAAFVLEINEYYHPLMGKIGTDEFQYITLKNQGNKKKRYTEEHLRLSFTNLREEILSSITFIE